VIPPVVHVVELGILLGGHGDPVGGSVPPRPGPTRPPPEWEPQMVTWIWIKKDQNLFAGSKSE